MRTLQTWIGPDGLKRARLFLSSLVNVKQVNLEEIPQNFRLPAPSATGIGNSVTPTQWLQKQPAPVYKHGRPLTWNSHYGYNGSIAASARIEFAKNWGYALSLGQEITPELIARLDDPQSDESIIAAFSLQNPQYPLEVIVTYRMPVPAEVPESAWVHNAAGERLNLFGDPVNATTQPSTPPGGDNRPVFSPLAPDSVWQLAGEFRAGPLRDLVSRGLRPKVVLDGGERGIPVWQWAQFTWLQDPAIVAAKNASGLSWLEYCSERKAHVEGIIFDAIKAAAPGATNITYFGADEGPLRNAWLTNPPYLGDDSGFWYRKYIKRFIDLPATTIYFNMINTGFTGNQDVLSQVTNATGLMLKQNEPFSYGWLNPGDYTPNTPGPAEHLRWIGFLKCWYFLGLAGYCYCYWFYPDAGFEVPFPEDRPPDWLWFKVAGSYVQAQFSYLSEFIWNSDILPGPKKHKMPTNDPAYEFPTGDSGARVLARKLRNKKEWLIVAWASEGRDRWVNATIPELGKVTVQATVQGTIYKAKVK